MDRKKMDKHFIRLARLTAQNLSKDPITKAGAVIVSADTRQISLGYNGFPAGLPEPPEHWERPHKYDRVIHAEINAVMNCPFDTKGCTLYCTTQPCHICLGHLRNAGIVRVVYSDTYKTMTTDHLCIWLEIAKLFDSIEQIHDVVAANLPEFIAAYDD